MAWVSVLGQAQWSNCRERLPLRAACTGNISPIAQKPPLQQQYSTRSHTQVAKQIL